MADLKLENGMNGEENRSLYCSNCGEKLTPNSKFCNYCGTPVVNKSDVEGKSKEELTERKSVFEGKIHKCPSCGEVLKYNDIKCPSCGLELRNNKSSETLSELSQKLEKIEKERIGKEIGLKDVFTRDVAVDEITMKETSIIRNFPIPSNKEDLIEFIVFAAANMNSRAYYSWATPCSTSDKALYEAWESKFEQAYLKAKVLITDSSEFLKIQEIYDDKRRAMKQEKNNSIRSGIIVFILCCLFAVAMVGSILYITENF